MTWNLFAVVLTSIFFIVVGAGAVMGVIEAFASKPPTAKKQRLEVGDPYRTPSPQDVEDPPKPKDTRVYCIDCKHAFQVKPFRPEGSEVKRMGRFNTRYDNFIYCSVQGIPETRSPIDGSMDCRKCNVANAKFNCKLFEPLPPKGS